MKTKEEERFSSAEVHVIRVSIQNFKAARHSKWRKKLSAAGQLKRGFQVDFISNSAGKEEVSTDWKAEDIPCRRSYWEVPPTSQKCVFVFFLLKAMSSSSQSCEVMSSGLLILLLNTGFHPTYEEVFWYHTCTTISNIKLSYICMYTSMNKNI